jgi:hypothetical protein
VSALQILLLTVIVFFKHSCAMITFARISVENSARFFLQRVAVQLLTENGRKALSAERFPRETIAKVKLLFLALTPYGVTCRAYWCIV